MVSHVIKFEEGVSVACGAQELGMQRFSSLSSSFSMHMGTKITEALREKNEIIHDQPHYLLLILCVWRV
jgi:putative salt-induced outer membrane protein YdiY